MKRIIVILTLGVLLLAGCAKEEIKIEDSGNIRVVTECAELSSYSPEVTYSASVSAIKEANLGTTLPGKVEKFYYEPGDTVAEGSLLAELSDELLQQAEIEYKTYEKDFHRMERLRAKGSVPEMDYDHIKAQYEAKLENYEMIRRNTQIKAPFNGTIIEYLVEEGENYLFNINLEPGYSRTSGVLRLMQLDKVRVEFEVGESEISMVREGSLAEMRFASYPDRVFRGAVSECKPYLNHLSRTMTAAVILDNEEGLLKPGMFAEVTITMPSRSGVMIPLQAIKRLSGTGDDIVYIVRNGVVESRHVERLYTNADRVAVSGVKEGENYIISGKSKVESGQQVQVVNGEE